MRKLIGLGILAALLAAPALAFVFEDTLLVGESRNYTTPAGYHLLVLVTVSEIERGAIFSVNGEYSEDIQEGEEFLFKDGSHMKVTDIIYGKRSYVEFSFSPGKGLPVPTNVGPAGSAQRNESPAAECGADADCPDDDSCTMDTCSAGVCVHTSLPDCPPKEVQPRERLPAAEPQGFFARAMKWIAGLFRRVFG